MRAVNLIPSDVRRAGPGVQPGGLGPGFVVLAGLGVALLLVTVYVLTSNTISDRKAKLATLQQQVAQEQAVASRLTPYASYTKLAQARLATVTQIAGSRFDWHAALADLSRVVPANTSLTSVLATVGPGSSVSSGSGGGGGGGSAGGVRGDIAAPAFQLSGCTASHDDVARLMSRLRLINDVQRVTLTDSVKGGSGAGGTTTTAGGGASGGCTAAQTDFDLVVFFQPVAGALPTAGSATGGTATSGTAAPAGSTPPPATPATTGSTPATTTPATAPTQPVSNSPATTGGTK